MTRGLRRGVIVLAALATTGVVLALLDGAPDPGVAVRCYAATMGTLVVLTAASWLRRSGQAPGLPAGSRHGGGAGLDTIDPAVAAWEELERALRFGATTVGDYRLLVEPRLRAVASERLGRRHLSLSDSEAAEQLLGRSFHLVDPRVAMPADRLAPGVPVAEIERLVQALEEM